MRGNAGILTQLQGCVRHVYALAQKHVDVLNRLPYVRCRLQEPGVRDRCLEQFYEVRLEDHDAVTVRFLSVRVPARAHIDELPNDGSGPDHTTRCPR